MLASLFDRGHVRIVVSDFGPALLEHVHQDVAWRLALVIHIGLVGQPEHEDGATLDRLLPIVKRVGHPVHHISGHGSVDLAGQLDEAGVLAIFPRFPSEVERINRDAMPAQARPRIEGHKAERLGLCGVDDLPDVDAHGAIDHLEFVHESDVHAAEGVFEQLRRLGGATGRHGHDRLDRHGVKSNGLFQASRRVAANNLGDERHLKNDKAQNEAEATKKVSMLMNRLASGEDFATLATDYSEQPDTSASGGDLGFIAENSLQGDKQAYEAIDRLKPGQFTPALAAAENGQVFGYRIIKLISREPAGQRQLNDPRVQKAIGDQLRDRREQLLKSAY